MPVILRTGLLLALSNVFMTFAWCGHLKNLNHQRWYAPPLKFSYRKRPY